MPLYINGGHFFSYFLGKKFLRREYRDNLFDWIPQINSENINILLV
uniref:Uncharacterized protein n=1 Tax=Anguilla anguilla TaxID=7936 RepID=A0A0E9PHZ6_ANGAN